MYMRFFGPDRIVSNVPGGTAGDDVEDEDEE
jgi:hypothetical protein